MSGRINNKYDAENEYIKKIKNDEDYLNSIKSTNKLYSESNKEHSAKGLKIMTPNQLLTGLPILLAQKKAGNNSQKLNNEIRQIIYSLYNSSL